MQLHLSENTQIHLSSPTTEKSFSKQGIGLLKIHCTPEKSLLHHAKREMYERPRQAREEPLKRFPREENLHALRNEISLVISFHRNHPRRHQPNAQKLKRQQKGQRLAKDRRCEIQGTALKLKIKMMFFLKDPSCERPITRLAG